MWSVSVSVAICSLRFVEQKIVILTVFHHLYFYLRRILEREVKMADVSDLVVQMHSNIDSIHQVVQTLSSTASHDTEMERLEKEREEKIAEVKAKHEAELQYLVAQRDLEERELAEQRKREEEELLEKRRREDEERRARVAEEEEERKRVKEQDDEKRRVEMEERERSLRDSAEAELERLEDEFEQQVEEGKKKLAELDEKRRVCVHSYNVISDDANNSVLGYQCAD